MMHDIMEYMKSENFKYLIIEASHGDYYGFNLRVKMERTYAMTIVSLDDRDDFIVVGWKVAKKLCNWVHNANSWIDFINGKEKEEEKEEEKEKMMKMWKKRRKQKKRKMRKKKRQG